MSLCLHVRWGYQPHVTSPTWGPPPLYKQALRHGSHEETFDRLEGLPAYPSYLGRLSRLFIHFLLKRGERSHDKTFSPCNYFKSPVKATQSKHALGLFASAKWSTFLWKRLLGWKGGPFTRDNFPYKPGLRRLSRQNACCFLRSR